MGISEQNPPSVVIQRDKDILYHKKSMSWKKHFKLDNEQLKAIVCHFWIKTEEGLKRKMQIQCIPTFIAQKQPILKESHWYLT